MSYPQSRLRRLRGSEATRKLVRETRLHPHDLLAPLFVAEGKGQSQAVKSMPGQSRHSVDRLIGEAAELFQLGVPGVLLFGVSEKKDALGKAAYASNGIVQQAVKALKKELPSMLVFTDVCLCEYTDHGHCGVVKGKKILNDPTLPLLAKMALSHADAGADF